MATVSWSNIDIVPSYQLVSRSGSEKHHTTTVHTYASSSQVLQYWASQSPGTNHGDLGGLEFELA